MLRGGISHVPPNGEHVWLVGSEIYVCFVAKLKKKAKRYKNKTKQKPKINVSRVGRDFFLLFATETPVKF